MQNLVKRCIDCLLGGLALVLLSPLLLIVALLIKIDSRGSVFFMQRRAGLHGKPFRIFKFRTMLDRSADAIDQLQEGVISQGHDPRITRVGRFIRGASIDELPQLLNIVKGDMSIVGPRPILMEQKEVVPPGYMTRFSVRPGLTGLAQVSGRRSLGWLQQLWLDAEYVKQYSLLYDAVIIVRTVKVVLIGGGIYGGEGMNWRTYRESLNGCAPADADVTRAMDQFSNRHKSGNLS